MYHSKNKYKLHNAPSMNSRPPTTTSTYSLNKTTTPTKSSRHVSPPSIVDNLLNQVRLKNKIIIENNNMSRHRTSALMTTSPIYKHQNTNKYTIVNKSIEPKLDVNLLLGRKVNNLSKNKFKFVKKKTRPTNPIHFGGKQHQTMKLDNRFKKKKKKVLVNPFNSFMKQFYNPYASPSSSQLINIKGVKYNLNKNGNKLKRLKTPQSTLVSTSNRFKLNNKNNKNVLNRVQNSQKILGKFIARLVGE